MDSKKGTINLEKTYIKDLSFEFPLSGQIISMGYSSRFDAEFRVNVTHIEKDRYEICLNLTGKGINAESEETVYLIEVVQAGIFLKEGEIDDESAKEITLTECPANLYPYLREVVDSILAKSGLPPLVLAPLDFKERRIGALSS